MDGHKYHVRWSVWQNDAYGQARFGTEQLRVEYIAMLSAEYGDDLWIKTWEAN